MYSKGYRESKGEARSNEYSENKDVCLRFAACLQNASFVWRVEECGPESTGRMANREGKMKKAQEA